MSEDKDKASTSSWHGGKGSLTRKGSNHRAYADNWENIFGKKDLPSAVDDAATAMAESAARIKALDELARLSQDMGLYDTEQSKPGTDTDLGNNNGNN